MAELTRREFLAGAVAAAGALATGAGHAAAAGSKFDGTIRVASLGGYDMLEPIRKRAERELGLRIVVVATSWEGLVELARQQPGAFDVFTSYPDTIDATWRTGGLRPVEIGRIERWPQLSPLFKLGKLQPVDPRCVYGQGDAPFRKLYLDPGRSGRWKSARGTPSELEGLLVQWSDERSGRSLGPEPRFCTGVPYIFNVESLGYNMSAIRKAPEQVSWAELLNRRWRGRAALFNGHTVGSLEAALAATAAGLMRFSDLGDMTRREIDALVKLLFVLKRRGHFRHVWLWQTGNIHTLMSSGEVVIASAAGFAAVIGALNAIGKPIRNAAPPEGSRAFAGLLSISSEVTDPAKLKACYDFINWYQSGFAGSVLLRDGFYSPVQETSRRFTAPGEYAYFIEGKPADRNYASSFGDVWVRKGQVREGGSLARRACRIAAWNSWPREGQHLRERWYELVSSFS